MIPSMVSIPERAILRDFLALNHQGIGEAVEIGAFCGSSAVAIMQGIQASRHRTKLHVYDAFLFPKNDLEAIYRKFLPRITGASFREEFDFQTRAWTEVMEVTEGDASTAKWSGCPIEFMHIDCSISREFHEAIAREFYPHLVIGGVVAHQDYEYGRAPFIAEMMIKLAPWFRDFLQIETTHYFRCERLISRDDLEAALRLPQAKAA